MLLAGKHAFVTGSGKRLGRHMAEILLLQGMNVSAHFYHSKEEVLELISWATQRGLGKVIPIQGDLTKSKEVQRLAEESLKQLGTVDLLIHSASDFFPTPLELASESDWSSLLDLNLKAPFFLTQQIAPSMRHGGHIVFIADVHGSRPISRYAPYCASKAGILSLTQSLAKELAPKIRVNSLSPGTLLLPDSSTEEDLKKASARTLLKRVGSPEDLSHGLLFLCRNEYVTGFDLIVDGGRALI